VHNNVNGMMVYFEKASAICKEREDDSWDVKMSSINEYLDVFYEKIKSGRVKNGSVMIQFDRMKG